MSRILKKIISFATSSIFFIGCRTNSLNADSLYYAETEQVKFIVPKEFSCDASLAYDIEGKDLYIYDLMNETDPCYSIVTLCSEYKADSSFSNLDHHWEVWKKKEHKEVSMNDVDRGVHP